MDPQWPLFAVADVARSPRTHVLAWRSSVLSARFPAAINQRRAHLPPAKRSGSRKKHNAHRREGTVRAAEAQQVARLGSRCLGSAGQGGRQGRRPGNARPPKESPEVRQGRTPRQRQARNSPAARPRAATEADGELVFNPGVDRTGGRKASGTREGEEDDDSGAQVGVSVPQPLTRAGRSSPRAGAEAVADTLRSRPRNAYDPAHGKGRRLRPPPAAFDHDRGPRLRG